MSTKKDKFSLKDKNYMKLALNLARARKGLTGDNPSVGCLIVKNDKIISIGQTGYNGRPHAEEIAIKIDLANLSLSKADFLPFFLTTIISLYWTLSKVVNLAPQTHNLLLRIAVPSSVGRESTTEVSPFLHIEQIIYSNFYSFKKTTHRHGNNRKVY